MPQNGLTTIIKLSLILTLHLVVSLLSQIQQNVSTTTSLHTATSLNQQHISCSKSCDANRKLGLSHCQSSVWCGCCAPHGENSCTDFHRNTATDESVSPMKVQQLHKHCLRFMVLQYPTGSELFDNVTNTEK